MENFTAKFEIRERKSLNDLIEFTNQRIASHLDELSISKDLIKATCFIDPSAEKK